jgi:hypothetical protein
MDTRAAYTEQTSNSLPNESRVALCFKVPFGFRQWFKLQALRRGLTMTEFLVKATEWYVETHGESSDTGGEAGSPYLRK